MSRIHFGVSAGKIALTGALVASLVCPVSPVAYAESSQELEAQADAMREERIELEAKVKEAQEQLVSLYAEAEQCENDLITVEVQLEETNERIAALEDQIADTRMELKETQRDLSDIIAQSYKNGRPNILSMVLSATSFDDLISRITYANKVSEHESQAIQHVRDVEARLGAEKTEEEQLKEQQELLVEQQKERLAAAEAAAAAVESYQAQLSDEIVVKIAEEEATRQRAAEEAAREAAEEARRRAEEEARLQAEAEARRQAEAEARRQAAEENGYTYVEDPDDGGESYSYSVGDVSSFVASAYSIIGAGYSYSGYNWTGSTGSSVFTCSGVIDFALGRAPRSSSPETLYAEVGSRLVYDTSQLNYGDLVFYSYAGRYPGHVGIYVGNGNIIDSIPGGVAVREVGYMPFIGGGPIL